LTGLLFILVSLGPRVATRTESTLRAFVSPIAVSFMSALVVSALMMTPHLPLALLASALAVGGVGGLAYIAWTDVHAQWRANKLPMLDWVWFVGLPVLSYVLCCWWSSEPEMHGTWWCGSRNSRRTEA
jgi:hypothetical protein